MILYVMIVWLLPIVSIEGCGLGRTVTKITVTRAGRYDIQCSPRPYPICPDVCVWTNQTCQETARTYKWRQEHLMMTNITYATGLVRTRKEETSATNNGVRTTQRRCCTATRMVASPCRTVDWTPDASKTEDHFDVINYAINTLACPSKNAIVRDVRLKTNQGKQLSIEVCCLNYTKDFSGRVVCLAPRKPGDLVNTAAAISLGVALPLALGIGIPALFFKNVCVKTTQQVPNTQSYSPQSPNNVISGTSSQCQAACISGGYVFCTSLFTINICGLYNYVPTTFVNPPPFPAMSYIPVPSCSVVFVG